VLLGESVEVVQVLVDAVDNAVDSDRRCLGSQKNIADLEVESAVTPRRMARGGIGSEC
jgi:hypothetical protein